MSKNIWFTSDWHLDHQNVIRFCNRPFSYAKEMNEKLISNYNELVKPGDHVYNLGDFCMSTKPDRWQQHLWRLNGKIHLIRGNHDREQTVKKVLKLPGIEQKLVWVKDYYKLAVQDKTAQFKKHIFILMHYAMRVWDRSHWGSFQLHGHSHGNLPEDPKAKQMDVGVDTNKYYPYHYEEVRDYLMKKDGHVIDHHGRKS